MKTRYVLFLLLLCFGSARAQYYSFEQGPGGPMDTMNRVIKGKKEGKWIIWPHGRESLAKEIGNYKNNRKEGLWVQYHRNGKIRNKVTYVNGVLNGPATFYNTDGKVMKEGSFKGNKWVQ